MGVDPKGTYEVWLGWHHIALEAGHAFVMVRDNNRDSKTYGWTWVYSGAPQRFNLESFTNAGFLMDRSGLYTSRQFDSRAANPQFVYQQVMLDSNEQPVAPLLNYLQGKRSELRSMGLKYNLLEGPNSNTFASAMLDFIGVREGWSRTRHRADWVVDQLRTRKGLVFPGWGWPRQ